MMSETEAQHETHNTVNEPPCAFILPMGPLSALTHLNDQRTSIVSVMRPLIVGTVMLIALLSPSISIAQQAQTPVPKYKCSFSPRIFSDLKTVYIDIDIQAGLAEAIKCIGHEEECLKSTDTVFTSPGISADVKAKYLQQEVSRFKQLTSGYPPALYPDHLTALLQPAIRAALWRAVPKGSSCQMPEPLILDASNRQAQRNSEDALTITFGVRVVDTVPARIAILTATYFRAEPGYTDYLSSKPMATAFPLDLPEADVAQILKQFVHITATVPMSNKDSVE